MLGRFLFFHKEDLAKILRSCHDGAACLQRTLDSVPMSPGAESLSATLTDDCIERILLALSFRDLLQAQRVCRHWSELTLTPLRPMRDRVRTWSLVAPYLMEGSYSRWNQIESDAECERFNILLEFVCPRHAERFDARGLPFSARGFVLFRNGLDSIEPAPRRRARAALLSLVCHQMKHAMQRYYSGQERMPPAG
jgi:hypothetical protein